MRYTWTVVGDDPDYAQGDKHGIDGYFWPCFDSLTTRENLTDCKNRGYAVGIYLGHAWLKESCVQQAAKVSEEYKRVYVPGLKTMFNWEQHMPDDIAAGLEGWRHLRPTVGTSWSMEGMQGGWMSKAFVARILAAKIRVVPQAFYGDMRRRESDSVLRDLTRRGFPEATVSIFYDAANLGGDWNGFAFTLGRLPYV